MNTYSTRGGKEGAPGEPNEAMTLAVSENILNAVEGGQQVTVDNVDTGLLNEGQEITISRGEKSQKVRVVSKIYGGMRTGSIVVEKLK